MSESLERFIAEQQKKIDQLKQELRAQNERWFWENTHVDDLADAAFSFLNHSTNPGSDFELDLKKALMRMGFCVKCQVRPCECEGQYDD
jgi:hypothetical protein